MRTIVLGATALILTACGEAPTAPDPAAAAVAAAPKVEAPAGPPPLPANLPAAPYDFTCTAFSTMTGAKLVEKFGADNVATEVLNGPTGEYVATVVLSKHPTHRLVVTWIDSSSKEKVETASIGGGASSEWVGVNGLKVGMPLLEIETLNGKPFATKNLDAYGWDGGAMVEAVPCTTHALLKVANGQGAGEFWSKDEGLRALQPIVSSLKLTFNQ